MNLVASLLLRLRAWDGWNNLLDRQRVRTLDFLLPGTSILRCSWPFPLRRRGHMLPCLLLMLLLHYGFTRLVTVMLALKLLLLLQVGITIS